MWHLRCNGLKLNLSQYVNVGMQLIHMFLGCVTCCQPVFGSRYDLVHAHKKNEQERGNKIDCLEPVWNIFKFYFLISEMESNSRECCSTG